MSEQDEGRITIETHRSHDVFVNSDNQERARIGLIRYDDHAAGWIFEPADDQWLYSASELREIADAIDRAERDDKARGG